ncbi:hypothetical protein SEA_GARDENSTATE_52 [Microbacterium phage GardenState]|uniref:Uncharacterized protein n=1 Tax=Microbacterium phage GardenState TaxID=2776841 RepID=A0A7L8ZEB7_9CAUD|nr:hypothetical protein SEA_GARDENSTATE_52 [Microbacterium phage GardenState]
MPTDRTTYTVIQRTDLSVYVTTLSAYTPGGSIRALQIVGTRAYALDFDTSTLPGAIEALPFEPAKDAVYRHIYSLAA